MIFWRILLLVVYLLGASKLDTYARKHFPPINKLRIPEEGRPWMAILLLWGPTLWFVPGLLWIGLFTADFHWLLVVSLSILVPLLVHAFFMVAWGIFPKKPPMMYRALFLLALLVICAIILIYFAFRIVGNEKLTFAFFFLSLVIPAITANVLLRSSIPQMIPGSLADQSGVDLMVKMVYGYYTTYPKPVWYVEDGKLKTRIKGNANLGSGASLLTTEPENLTGRKAGPRFVGISEPGTTLVDDGSVPSQVIDLRNQIRITKVNCITRDGIDVKVPLSSLFKIDWRGRMPEAGTPWPYTLIGAEKACVSALVNPVGKTPLEEQPSHLWDDLPLLHASKALRRAIRYYTLDQLYGPALRDSEVAGGNTSSTLIDALDTIHQRVADELGVPFRPSPHPQLTRQVIGKMVQEYVRKMLTDEGYDIMGGGIGAAIVPVDAEVTRKRIEAWKIRAVIQKMAWQMEDDADEYTQLMKVQESAFDAFYRKALDAMQNAESEQISDNSRNRRMLYWLRRIFQRGSQQEIGRTMLDFSHSALDDETGPEDGES